MSGRAAWVEVVQEQEATGEVRTVYQAIGGGRLVPLDNILKCHALNPDSLRAHYLLYATVMRGPSGLSRAEREAVAVVVSQENRCHY